MTHGTFEYRGTDNVYHVVEADTVTFLRAWVIFRTGDFLVLALRTEHVHSVVQMP